MPRIIWNEEPHRAGSPPPIEIHYGSPNEFIREFEGANSSASLFLGTDRSLPVGAEREIVLHVGFIGRVLRLLGRVQEVTSVADSRRTGHPPGVEIALVGPDGGPCAELLKIVQQIQQGLAYQAARAQESASGERLSREKQIRQMPATLKIMLALKAEREDRLVLANDPDPQAVQFLLKNSRLTLEEVRALAARTTLNHQHLTTITANPGWIADDQVKINLARNPRLPETLVEPILSSMNVNQLKIVAGAVSTSPKARRIAHRILYTRGA